MAIHALSNALSVTGRIRPEDPPAITRAGYRSIICNRHDAEAPDQPGFRGIGKDGEFGMKG
ncbi:MAG: hypothetical protein ACKO4A_10105 [Gammaproteobacteria bacterium]